MKKQHLKLSLIGGMLLAMSATVNAQWTETGSAVYLTNGTKNVGIGTTTPAFALDLIRSGSANLSLKSTTGTSNLLLDRANSAATSSVSYRTNGVGTWQTGTVGTDNFAIRNIGLGNTAFTVLAANNNVGIGTTNPGSKLSVGGTASITVDSAIFAVPNWAPGYNTVIAGYFNSKGATLGPQVRFGNTGAQYYDIGMDGNANFSIEDNDNTRLTIKPGGNVGIGTTTPAERLTVQTATSSYGFTHTDGTITVGSYVGGIAGGGWFGTKSNHNLNFFTNNSSAQMTLSTSGNVGIGTTAPADKLTVETLANSYGITHTDGTRIFSTFLGAPGVYIGSKSNHNLHFYTNGGAPQMTLNTAGNVSIGTQTAATGYKLTVAGKIICTELKVQLQPFPDYVFAKDYNLKSLSEVEDHIKTYNRLPGMPSACEVEENGMSVGEMQGKMVEKVEELTLYIIQQQKQIDELKALITSSKK